MQPMRRVGVEGTGEVGRVVGKVDVVAVGKVTGVRVYCGYDLLVRGD